MAIRPYTMDFLRWASSHFEVFVFTASHKTYAKLILERIDPKNEFFKGVLSREMCVKTKNGHLVKDLRIFVDRNLDSILIIDNLVQSFGFQLSNGFPILEWQGSKNDKELLHLMDFLQEYVDAPSISELNRRLLRLEDLALYSPEIVFAF